MILLVVGGAVFRHPSSRFLHYKKMPLGARCCTMFTYRPAENDDHRFMLPAILSFAIMHRSNLPLPFELNPFMQVSVAINLHVKINRTGCPTDDDGILLNQLRELDMATRMTVVSSCCRLAADRTTLLNSFQSHR